MDPDQLFFGRALARIYIWIAVLSACGAIAAGIYGGWRWTVGFLLGAGGSWINFRWIRQLVNSLGDVPTAKPPRKRLAVILGLRYLLLGIAAYAILNFTALSLAGAFFGLFVPVAAVILEILFELVYAGT